MSFRFCDLDALTVDFEQVIISVVLCTVLFANQVMKSRVIGVILFA